MSPVAVVILVDNAAERSGFWCVSLRRSDGHLLELLVGRSEIHAILPGIGNAGSRRPRAASSDRCHVMLGGQLLRLVLDPPMEYVGCFWVRELVNHRSRDPSIWILGLSQGGCSLG